MELEDNIDALEETSPDDEDFVYDSYVEEVQNLRTMINKLDSRIKKAIRPIKKI